LLETSTGAIIEGTSVLTDNRGTRRTVRLFGGMASSFDVRADGRWLVHDVRHSVPKDAHVLDGVWRFRTADSPWGSLRVPGYWESQGVIHTTADAPEPTWAPYNGTPDTPPLQSVIIHVHAFFLAWLSGRATNLRDAPLNMDFDLTLASGDPMGR